jgi:hypothetical protein
MPLTVNVWISKAASTNYQSAGLTINLTAAIDQAPAAYCRQEYDHERAHSSLGFNPPAV